MVVPSRFVPLAAPGVVTLGLKWMRDPESPFYVKPRLRPDLLAWGFRFWRSATRDHVERSAPLLRDLGLKSRACFEEFAALPGNDFGLEKKGLLLLCKTEHTLEEEARTAERGHALGIPSEVLDAKQTARREPGVRMDVAGSIDYPQDCHLAPERLMGCAETPARRPGRDVRLEHGGDRLPGQRLATRGRADEPRRLQRRRVRSLRGLLVAGPRAPAAPLLADPGRQGIQPHAQGAAPASHHLRDLRGGTRGGDADGPVAALRRHAWSWTGSTRPSTPCAFGASSNRYRPTTPTSRPAISRPSGPGPACARARRTAFRISGGPRGTRTSGSRPATPWSASASGP